VIVHTKVGAWVEDIAHLERGLALLKALPASTDQDGRKPDFLIAMDHPISGVRGWADPEFAARSDRATALSEKLGIRGRGLGLAIPLALPMAPP